LLYLERANLFISPLDNQRQWYRYHPLFADLLRHRLKLSYPDQVATLHLRAGQWYEQAGLTAHAIRHALAAQAFGYVADLVEQVAPAMIQRGELAGLLKWLEALPDKEVRARPLLTIYYARVLLIGGQTRRAATLLASIEAKVAAAEEEATPEVQGHIAALQAYLARESGDFAGAILLFRQALAHLPRQESLFWAMDTLNLAIAHYLQDEFELASPLLTELIAIGETAQLPANTLAAIYLNAQLLRVQGALREAIQLCQAGMELVARRQWHNFPAVGFLYVAFGDLLCECNELTRAAEYLEKGIKLGEEGGHPHIMLIGNVRLAWLRQLQGDVAGSHEAIRATLQITQHREVSHAWPVPSAACCEARLWIAQGNLAAASRWAQATGLEAADTPVTYLYETEQLTLARLWIAQDNLDAAEPLLLRLHRQALSAKRNGSLIQLLVLQAITYAAQERNEAALAALEQALALAEAEGFVRVFLDEGAPMVALLRRAVARELHANYALHLLEEAGESIMSTASPQPLIEALSERELEVLRRVAAGYSNREIGQELVVAVSTVKRHISNIYGKLEVTSRTQAVAKAKELDLL
jgi:LuxR family maltose regulon positive regulatory protein